MSTIILIDGGYLNSVLDQEFGRPKIDYLKFVKLIADGRSILRTYYHFCEPYVSDRPTEDELMRRDSTRSFLRALELQPRFQVRLGQLELRGVAGDGRQIFVQKRVDLQIGLDLVTHAFRGHIDSALLVTGDSDLIPAIEAAKREGVIVTIVHGEHPHRDLLTAADERRRITQADIDSVLAQQRLFEPRTITEADADAATAPA